jgi:hypothetical protein
MEFTWEENANGLGAEVAGGVPGASLLPPELMALLASVRILAMRSSDPSGPKGKVGVPRCWSSVTTKKNWNQLLVAEDQMEEAWSLIRNEKPIVLFETLPCD